MVSPDYGVEGVISRRGAGKTKAASH
jgi:hypothetical protein